MPNTADLVSQWAPGDSSEITSVLLTESRKTKRSPPQSSYLAQIRMHLVDVRHVEDQEPLEW